MAENIDLAKTFTAIGGTTLPSDGHSLLALLHGDDAARLAQRDPGRASGARPARSATPTSSRRASGNPPSYEAMRTHNFLYVEYADGEREYYDLRTDPFELDNLAPYMPAALLAELHSELLAMERCHNGVACWAAMHVDGAAADLHRR